jgi:trichodiene synthase
MDQAKFPTSSYCSSLARFLRAIEYDDTNWHREDRIKALHIVHVEMIAYFASPLPQQALKDVDAKLISSLTHFVPQMTVSCWSRVSTDVLVDIGIFLAIMTILDDHLISHEPEILSTFWTDLLQGREQKNPLWMLINDHLPKVLRHYGSFCAWNIMRGTFDFFQGCWIEQSSFQGYPGADCFPEFVRRLNGLGSVVAGTSFPYSDFDQKELFQEMSCVMAHMDGVVTSINDLLSYYKEFDQDEANLVSNWCVTDGIDKVQALQRLTDQTIHACKQILEIFADRDSGVRDAIRCFIHGFVTSHLCSERYRLRELYDRATGTDADAFRAFYEQAINAAMVDTAEWTQAASRIQTEVDLKASAGRPMDSVIQVVVTAL